MVLSTYKLDRRKRYTRKVLKNSLMALLKEKQISTITVKELCELADINRSTFYAHYSNHFDLLTQIEDELIDDMNKFLTVYSSATEDTEILKMTEKLLEYLASKKEDCQILLSEKAESTFQQKVADVAHEHIMKYWLETSEDNKDTIEYLSAFIISGSIQMMKLWLENDMDKSPRQMALLINNFVNKGILDEI